MTQEERRASADAGLPVPAVALRHEPRRPARAPTRSRSWSARAPSPAAAACCWARRSPSASPRMRDLAGRHRPAQRLPPSRLDRARRPRDQDPRAARDHRLAEADLRQGRRQSRPYYDTALAVKAGRRRGRARRHAGRHGGDAGRVHRACRPADPGRRSARRCRRCRTSACTARCS